MSRTARRFEYCQTARQDFGCPAASQTGSMRFLTLLTVLFASRRDRDNYLSVGETSVPKKMVREIGGCFGDAGPDDELQPHLIEGSKIAGRERPQRSPSPRP